MRFCDILRVKSEFPINLWPNAVYVYARRIRAFVAGNESWSAFARALLTAQGSNFRDGEVNFFRATDTRTPDGWAQCVAQTFFGRAFTAQEAEERAYVSSRFANLRIKTTREWKEEIVYVEGPDRRADVWSWVFDRHRLRAKAAFEKRLNTWIFGPGDPGASLEGVSSDRLQDLLRAIVLSEAYARGSVTGGFPARRLDAEVLDDAFCSLSGFSRNYQSPAPEPFSFIPPKRPTVCLEDGSISSGFLSLFGRPARDTGTMAERGGGITAKQRLYLFNSRDIHNKIRAFSRASAKRPDDLYWNLLARAPTAHERRILSAAWTQRKEGAKNGKPAYSQFLQDVAWSLVNGKEFLLRT
jgi:hypothetical protein